MTKEIGGVLIYAIGACAFELLATVPAGEDADA
jgi:hypothetical protein